MAQVNKSAYDIKSSYDLKGTKTGTTDSDFATEKVGNYSQPGIHDGDERDASGMKKKFDRGDPGEDKRDIIQEKGKFTKPNVDQPVEYTQAGMNPDVPQNASGKLKFDRAAPEENPDALRKLKSQSVVHSETSKPNYVEEEAMRHKYNIVKEFSGKDESNFLQGLVAKAEAGGWRSPIIDDIKHRIEYLGK